MPPQTRRYRYKVVLLGDSQVGKTSLIRRFVDRSFHEDYQKTLGAVISKHTEPMTTPEGEVVEVSLIIWDIMGQKGLRDLLREAYLNEARGALAVFDVTRRETLEGLQEWIDGTRAHDAKIPVMVLGNKNDLVDRRAVTEEEARSFCLSQGLQYLPTSAKTGFNVEEAFHRLTKEILKLYAGPRVAA